MMVMRFRFKLVPISLLVLPVLVMAQPKQLITSVRNNAPVATTQAESQPTPADGGANATPNEPATADINTMPLFGERAKTSEQIDQEIRFLNDCDRNFATRPEASKFFTDRGWDYVASGQLDTAAYRFNLAWLLHENNADAYWGLGVVSYQKNQLPDAIRMLKRGLTVADSNITLMADLATVQIKYHQEHNAPGILTDAETTLQRAVSISPSASAYQKLSLINYLKADYVNAWSYFHQARNLDLTSLDLGYLSDLIAKQPDPQGVFK